LYFSAATWRLRRPTALYKWDNWGQTTSYYFRGQSSEKNGFSVLICHVNKLRCFYFTPLAFFTFFCTCFALRFVQTWLDSKMAILEIYYRLKVGLGSTKRVRQHVYELPDDSLHDLLSISLSSLIYFSLSLFSFSHLSFSLSSLSLSLSLSL
jgi:hypothetical protein